jgi:thiamine-phosphate pyrophosphorylase
MPAKEVRSNVLPRIHCVTDFPEYDGRTLDALGAVVREGVDAVQVRAKSLTDRDLFTFTRALLDRLTGTSAMVIVDERVDVALAAGAHGVHLGVEDLPVGVVRDLVPYGFVVGATCRGAAQACEARVAGADYAGVGPVYATATKAALPPPIGLDPLGEAARELPVIAIAGITEDLVPQVLAAGAHGVAVAGAICHDPDPPAAARRIVEAVAGS